MLIEIKHRFNASVIFSHNVSKNTVALTLIAAIAAGANLSGANLSGADLSGTNLSGANLSRTNLYGADLSRTNLYGANLYGADLSGTNLYGANLSGADLSGTNLSGANLSRTNLYGADLSGTNLSGANLSGTNLSGAINATLLIAQTRILPDEGDVIGFKKCRDNIIVKLLIPSSAKRCHAMGRKCRAEYAKVLSVCDIQGNIVAEGISQHDGKTTYVVGETVHCDKWGEDWTIECSGGIHFFITRIEAENY